MPTLIGALFAFGGRYRSRTLTSVLVHFPTRLCGLHCAAGLGVPTAAFSVTDRSAPWRFLTRRPPP